MNKEKIFNRVLAGLAVAEGICASSVVDSALKLAPGNKYVNALGRGAISALISTVYSAAAVMLWTKETEEDEKSKLGLHKVTFVDAEMRKTREYHMAGETIELDATDLVPEGAEFCYWYCTKGDVEFSDEKSPTSFFFMPDEDVRIEFSVGHFNERTESKEDADVTTEYPSETSPVAE